MLGNVIINWIKACDITILVSFHSKFPVIGTTHFIIQIILIYLMIDRKKRDEKEGGQSMFNICNQEGSKTRKCSLCFLQRFIITLQLITFYQLFRLLFYTGENCCIQSTSLHLEVINISIYVRSFENVSLQCVRNLGGVKETIS